MHRLAGIAIYYASLLALYFAVACRVGKRAPKVAPLFWYSGVTLGVPLAGRVCTGVTPEFAGHTAWVMGVVLFITLVKTLPSALRNRVH
jgi:hypothetical protein